MHLGILQCCKHEPCPVSGSLDGHDGMCPHVRAGVPGLSASTLLHCKVPSCRLAAAQGALQEVCTDAALTVRCTFVVGQTQGGSDVAGAGQREGAVFSTTQLENTCRDWCQAQLLLTSVVSSDC